MGLLPMKGERAKPPRLHAMSPLCRLEEACKKCDEMEGLVSVVVTGVSWGEEPLLHLEDHSGYILCVFVHETLMLEAIKRYQTEGLTPSGEASLYVDTDEGHVCMESIEWVKLKPVKSHSGI